jgi:hypothetical protein
MQKVVILWYSAIFAADSAHPAVETAAPAFGDPAEF